MADAGNKDPQHQEPEEEHQEPQDDETGDADTMIPLLQTQQPPQRCTYLI